MKCTNKKKLFFGIGIFLIGLCAGCGSKTFDMAYSPNYPVSSYRMDSVEENEDTAVPFARDLCVVDSDVSENTDVTYPHLLFSNESG